MNVSTTSETVDTLAVRVTQVLSKYDKRSERIIALQAAPEWRGPLRMEVDDRAITVAPCISVLAILSAITDHDADDSDTVLVILTDVPEAELGSSILSHCRGQQVFPLDRWSLVEQTYDATIDPRLRSISWMAEALLAGTPYPTQGSGSLTLDAAFGHLARRWLGVDDDELGLRALLSATEAGRHEYSSLPVERRRALHDWLLETVGRAADPLLRSFEADPSRDPLAVGIVCAALWSSGAAESAGLLQARGRAEALLGGAGVSTEAIEDFGTNVEAVVRELLASKGDAERHALQALQTAERLLVDLHAVDEATATRLLPIGFTARIDTVADHLQSWLRKSDQAQLAALEHAVAALREHIDAIHNRRVVRAEMAARLCRWLPTPQQIPETVDAGLTRQVREWGWVDWALAHIYAGDAGSKLGDAYEALHTRARERRSRADEAFARALAAWTKGGGEPGQTLIVERLLHQIIAPLAKELPTLLIVLDGMSAAVAAELGALIRRTTWTEIGLIDDAASDGIGRRRGVAAALPTVTKVSRAALLTGELQAGTAEIESKRFPDLECWGYGRGRLKAALFHKSAIAGDPGHELDAPLRDILAEPGTFVAVVLNAIDEALEHGRDTDSVTWRLEDVRWLQPLLDRAAEVGRTVVLTSDHGHILEHGTTYRQGDQARYRSASNDPASDEVLLDGPRVVAPGNRIIAPWAEDVRHGPLKAGYHGGASLAEVTIPLLAFVPHGASIPSGWGPVLDPEPSWWQPAGAAPTAEPIQPIPRKKRRPSPDVPPGQEVLALPEPSSLADRLLASETYAVQRAPLRQLRDEHVRAAVSTLLDAGGYLPKAVLAQRAGIGVERADGFISMLQRLLNVEGFPVLVLADGGVAVRLDKTLLSQQFDLSRAV